MLKIYKIIVLLLLAGRVAAQGVVPRAAPTTFRGGSYQLLDGAWQRGKLLYGEHNLQVIDADHRQSQALVYSADSVRAFVIGRDTFETVREVDIPRPAHHLRSTFARHLYRRAGFQVAELVAYPAPPEAPVVYTLLVGPGSVVVLPASNVQFRLALAKALHEYTALAQQLELDPNILPQQLPELLTAYGRWKSTSGAASTK